jgi:endonuclease III
MRETKNQKSRSIRRSTKKPFDIDRAFELIRTAIKDYRPAAMFELADDGFNSVFELLLACIISIRTRDETTVPASRRLFERARTPEAVARMSAEEIDNAIRASTFHEAKARQILAIAKRTGEEFGGTLPCDDEVFRSFSGVGPKCANLVLGIACGKKAISVDIHVHRVTNRWGYVQAPTPERTMAELEQVLPKKYWIEINRLLIPFGKHICTGELPKCSTCPVLEMCKQVGVAAHR